MANPMDALRSYQKALETGMPFYPEEFDGAYLKRNGQVNGAIRFDYVKIIDGKVQALAMFAQDDPFKGVDRYCVAYAVSEAQRGQGLAVEAVNKGFEDLTKKFSEAKITGFYIEAMIDATNIHSIRVAKQLFPSPGVPTTDSETGTQSLLFFRLIAIS